jgi:hypothetical protein
MVLPWLLALLVLLASAEESDPRLIGWQGETFHREKVFNHQAAGPRMEVLSWRPRVFK